MKDVNNLDVMMKNLVKNNIAKIKSTTPVNPSIKKDDEWREENSWDELYKELSKVLTKQQNGLMLIHKLISTH